MKKILFLGAATFQIPPIQYALDAGYEVITADYLPDNPGHRLAHRAHVVSTIDREAILRVAQQEQIDGIMTFGSDVSAPTAAYVAAQMGLPGNPLDAVETLTDKARFRACLNRSGIQPLAHRGFAEGQFDAAMAYLNSAELPLVIKPVDSSGSKGVSILRDRAKAHEQLTYAFDHSIAAKRIVIEQYVQKHGKQVCGDGFVVNGKLAFVGFGDGHFYDDGHFLAPYAETFPGTHSAEIYQRVRNKLQQIITAVGLQRGAFNLDVLVRPSGEPFIIEIGPRNGGNFIPRALHLNYGVDTVGASVESALDAGYQLPAPSKTDGAFYACYMVHSRSAGRLVGLDYADEIRPNLFETNAYLDAGASVNPFHKANAAIGNLIFRFETFEEMQSKMAKINSLVMVKLN